ncbi:MAG: hypothetical protein A3K19_31415 [Lentisphaerae bacterium RIFOXYB12_FULL_65_16]|nr:MAG: hypothetical protein A3K18_10160 [Lentisphaerae bacterium RIFOXYA12_64_32]OGV88555.1 MAG: hypothetical protein A3K19_31415 [Lentisphaerae bacterium RIFOXYB12_FULL_65_16]
MAELRELVATTGRVPYQQLLALLRTCSPTEFTRQAKHPLLVGHKLYQGELVPRQTMKTGTMRFNIVQIQEEMARQKLALEEARNEEPAAASQEDSVAQAIFVLRKKLPSKTLPNIFTIGRASENDIVIADYAVSKAHAHVTVSFNSYTITDLSSTNGTTIENQPVQPNTPAQLAAGTTIRFGRLGFVFMRPVDLYTALMAKLHPA